MTIYTSRYQNGDVINESGLVPIRITAGHPRFALKFELAGAIKELAPTRDELGIHDVDLFNQTYSARIDGLGVGWVDHAVRELAGPRDSVLLCFESIPHQGEHSCHRRALARWYEAASGIVMPEIEDRSPFNNGKRPARAKAKPKPELFPRPSIDTGIYEKAIANHLLLQFRYTDAKGKTSDREVEPRSLRLRDDGVIDLHAFDTVKQELRSFRLDRIDDLRAG